MSDIRIGPSLGVFSSRNDALHFARKMSGSECAITSAGGGFEVLSLHRSGHRATQLDATAVSTNVSRAVMSSNFIPTCTDFVINDSRGRRTSIENHDVATFIRREQAKRGFFDKPAVEQVGFWETGRYYADTCGGSGPNELAVLRQLARAIRESIQDPTNLARLNALEESYVTTCETQDLSTLENVRSRVHNGEASELDIENAAAAICRSYTSQHVTLAKEIDTATTRRWSRNAPPWASRYSMVVREFSVPLEGAKVREDQYDNPVAMMTFGQNDFLSLTRQDKSRCGAASLVAAAIVIGPEALGRLAEHFGVLVDAGRPTAGPLHLLMEQIYVQTLAAYPDGDGTLAGLSENQVSALVSQLIGPTPEPRLIPAGEFDEGDANIVLLAIGGSQNEHAVLMFRDPKTKRMALYEPAAFGPAASVFRNDHEKQQYLEERTLHSYPGQILVVASA